MTAIEMFRSLLAAQSSAGRGISPAAAPLALRLAEQLTIDAREAEDLAGALARACSERDDLASRLGSALAQLRAARASTVTPPPPKPLAAASGTKGARLGPDAFFDAAGLTGRARGMLPKFRATLAREAKRDPAAFRARVERERMEQAAERARQRARMRADCSAGVATLGIGVADWYREIVRLGYGPAIPAVGEHGPAFLPDALPALPPAIPAERKRGAA